MLPGAVLLTGGATSEGWGVSTPCPSTEAIMNKQQWNKLYEDGREFSPVSEILLDDLSLKGRRVLDVGCGKGQLMKQLKRRGFGARGIDLSDYSPDMTGDFLGTDVGMYDIIFANLVIAFNDTEKFLDKVKQHLNPGGMFVCITPILLDYDYDAHTKSISIDYNELISALKDRFEVKEIHRNYFGSNGVTLTVIGYN